MKLFIKIPSWLKRGSRREKVAALVLLGFFMAIYLVIPSQVPVAALSKEAPLGYSPRLFPYIITILAIILSLGVLIKGFARTSGVAEGGKGILGVEQVRRITPVVAITVIYIFLFGLLGFIVSAILCLGALLGYYGLSFRKEWKVAIPLIILFPLFIYYVFKVLLYVPLPAGLLRMLGF